MNEPEDTTASAYTDRLTKLSTGTWKRLFDTQRPYRWNLRRLQPGRTLDVGCGIGRNLVNLSADSVGVDHNVHSVEAVRRAGLTAYSSEEFPTSPEASEGSFDSLLLSHVIEHLDDPGNRSLLTDYLPFLDPTGQIIVICPQEKGFASDSTHVQMYDFDGIASLLGDMGFTVTKSYSFPLPRVFGKMFTYNEFVVVARSSDV